MPPIVENRPVLARDVPPLDWRVLNDAAQIASKDGQVVAVAYTVEASDTSGENWLEFCWIPIDKPDLIDVLFGVGPGAGFRWDNRWESARKATEIAFAIHLGIWPRADSGSAEAPSQG